METTTPKQAYKELYSQRPSTKRSSLSGLLMYHIIRFIAWILVIAGILIILWSIIGNIPAVFSGSAGNNNTVVQTCCVFLFIIAFLLFYCSKLIRKIMIRNNYIDKLEELMNKILND